MDNICLNISGLISSFKIPSLHFLPAFRSLFWNQLSPGNACFHPVSRLSIRFITNESQFLTTVYHRPLRLCIFDAKSIYKPRAKCNFHSVHTVHTVATFCKILLQTDHRSSYVEFLRDSPYPLSLSLPPSLSRKRKRFSATAYNRESRGGLHSVNVTT